MADILIIDDDRTLCGMMETLLSGMQHGVTCTHTADDGLEKAVSGRYDVVFLDVFLPDGNGLDLLPRIREGASRPEVIIFTGEGDPDGAELAIMSGAWDYVRKPPSVDQLKLPLTRALQYREERKGHRPQGLLKRCGIIGSSALLEACLEKAARAAAGDAAVLITGETGTGKELFARAIHENSPRADQRFVVVDCGALPDSLVESTLFGNVKGAFTGADRAREGLVKQAHGGTLFLDEIGELPLAVQKTFLRVIQEKRFLPVGARKETEVDFRLISATNRDLSAMVRKQGFRSDLLFRIRAQEISLPPLRERGADINDLILHTIRKSCKAYGLETKGLSPEFFEALRSYPWPGNVRELFNTVDEAIASARHEPVLFPFHLPNRIRAKLARARLEEEGRGGAAPGPVPGPFGESAESGAVPSYRDYRNEAERQYLERLMRATGGRKTEACRMSGLSRTRLFELLKKHDLSA